MTFAIDPGPLDRAFDHACARLEQSRFADALCARRADVWTSDASVRRAIAGRLGWVRAIETSRPHLARLRAFANAVRGSGIRDVVLLGMGGSSLAAEVLRTVAGSRAGFPRFHVLDSVDPDAVRRSMETAATSLFIVASKSGTTIEVEALAAEAARRVRETGAADHGSHFVAITDEGTPLHRRALDERFRDVFVNPSDVGGRFSVLTFFGLVPAALMGIDADALLESAQAMADACRAADPRRNPGLALGAMLAAAGAEGRDKLVLRLPPELASLGLWIEQLLAESTGKDGKGLVPIVGENDAAAAGEDRLVVEIAPGGSSPHGLHAQRDLPHVRLMYDGLGAEFFRWEVATATAGFLLGVNPFDEPDVQQAKDATRALLTAYASDRRPPRPEGNWLEGDVTLALSQAVSIEPGEARPYSVRRVLFRRDYFCVLAYLPPEDPAFTPMLHTFRTAVVEGIGSASMLEFGPRYLHSTGQLHKGGANSGVFLILTAESRHDLPVPGQPYSFGVLEMAQALGDFQALNRLGRRVFHVHLPRRDPLLFQRVAGLLVG